MNSCHYTRTWAPCEDLLSKYQETNFAVVILNTHIADHFSDNFILNLWNHAKIRHTVDGGTEQWLKWLKRKEYDIDHVIPPHLITGDMDSLPIKILDHFANNKSTSIVKTPNQDEPDFAKALRELNTYAVNKNLKVDIIYVLVDTCGRLDQIMTNINTLYKAEDIFSNTTVILLASDSLTWLLCSGIQHIISIPEDLRKNNIWCSLLPIGEPCCVKTTGLRWNLDNQVLNFGGLISTSNTYDVCSTNATVTSDKPLIWCMGIDSLFS